MTKHFAVLGSPISHSKSPQIHTAAYVVLGKDFDYVKIQVEKNHLMQFVETLDESWGGLSVTAPLKAEALRLSVKADEASRLTGAANTLFRTEAGWEAMNTDVFGIQKALADGLTANVVTASVIGSGATSVSAVLALVRSYPEVRLLLSARNRETLSQLVDFARSLGVKDVRAVSVRKALSKSDLVLSTLPAKALDDQIASLNRSRFFKPAGVLFDVAYEPWPSAAAQLWSSKGLAVISGVEMLLWQAIGQIRIFSEGDANRELYNESAVMLAMRDSIGLI
jgi:shikimate dehydrogenase